MKLRIPVPKNKPAYMFITLESGAYLLLWYKYGWPLPLALFALFIAYDLHRIYSTPSPMEKSMRQLRLIEDIDEITTRKSTSNDALHKNGNTHQTKP